MFIYFSLLEKLKPDAKRNPYFVFTSCISSTDVKSLLKSHICSSEQSIRREQGALREGNLPPLKVVFLAV
jgi:hypothetical protein